jgi:hypothetical protein
MSTGLPEGGARVMDRGFRSFRAIEIYLIRGDMNIALEGYELTSNSRFPTSISSLGAHSIFRRPLATAVMTAR